MKLSTTHERLITAGSFTGIEHAVLSSVEELQYSAFTTGSRRIPSQTKYLGKNIPEVIITISYEPYSPGPRRK